MENVDTTRPHFRLYCAVAGNNGPFDPSHVFTWRAEDRDTEAKLADNCGETPERLDGKLATGFYSALRAGLMHVAGTTHGAASEVTLIAPHGSELYWVFRETSAQRQAAGYRKVTKGKKVLRSNHLQIREVDRLCAEHSITLIAREPQSNHEIETRYLMEDEARGRLKDAWAREEVSAA